MPHTIVLDAMKRAAGPLAPVVKEHLSLGEEEMRRRHLAGETGRDVCRAYTSIIDNLLKALYAHKSAALSPSDKTVLVAMGGYGRGELNMKSDIDLMLVHKGRITKTVEDFTQQMLYLLWDTGLDLGFAIRSVPESIALAKDDLKTMTALLDLRYLTGDKALYDSLHRNIRKNLFSRSRTQTFIKDKLEETRQRHAKFGGSIYILEPNVKEGEGGLRDLQTAMWVVKARNGKNVEPFSLGLIREHDKKAMEESLDYLLWVRNELHFGAGRKTDQLTFDHQERIAGLLGFENSEKSLAVESFMQQYYNYIAIISVTGIVSVINYAANKVLVFRLQSKQE